jgi:hypothetical protein
MPKIDSIFDKAKYLLGKAWDHREVIGNIASTVGMFLEPEPVDHNPYLVPIANYQQSMDRLHRALLDSLVTLDLSAGPLAEPLIALCRKRFVQMQA